MLGVEGFGGWGGGCRDSHWLIRAATTPATWLTIAITTASKTSSVYISRGFGLIHDYQLRGDSCYDAPGCHCHFPEVF